MPDGNFDIEVQQDRPNESQPREDRRRRTLILPKKLLLRGLRKGPRRASVERQKDRVWRLLENGIVASKAGDMVAASEAFREACTVDPNNKIALEMAAFAANRTNDWDAAYEYWTKLGLLNETRGGPQRHRLNALIRGRRWDEATLLAEKLIDATPEDAKLRSALVEIALERGDVAAAQLAARSAFETNPELVIAERLMEVFLSAKLPLDAEEWTRIVEAQSPGAVSTVLSRARIAYISRDYDAAEAALQTLREHETLDDTILKKTAALRGRIAVNRGDFDAATRHFQQTLGYDPENTEAIGFLVNRKLRLRRFDEAQEMLVEKGWHKDPVQSPIWEARRRAARGDVKAGLRILSRAVDAAPDRVPLVTALVELQMETGDLDAARQTAEQYREAFGEVSDIEESLFRIAIAQDWSHEGKVEQVKRVLALNPRNTSLLNALGTLLVKAERRADAAEHYVEAVGVAPNSAMLWRNGAYHLRMIDQTDRAGAFAREAEDYFSREKAEEAAELAAIYRNAGLAADAEDCAEAGLALKPTSKRANEIAADIALDQGNYRAVARSLSVVADDPERKLRTTVRAAKVQTAFRVLEDPRGNALPTPNDRLYPEALFDRALELAVPDYSPDRKAVVNVTGSLAGGGAERQVTYSMAGFMSKPEIAPHVALVVDSLDPTKARDFYLKEIQGTGCPVYCLEDTRMKGRIRNFIAEHPELREKIQLINAMPAEISRYALPLFVELYALKPRVVHLWQDMTNMSGFLASILAGVPRIIVATRNTRPLNQRRLRRYMPYVYQSMLKYPGTVCINNSGIGARDYEEWLGFEEGTISPLYNGYDFSLIQKKASASRAKEIRADLGIPEDALIVGGAMRFATIKRPDMWVKVLTHLIERHDNVYGVLCGDGPMRDTLLKEVEAAGLSKRIILAGRQSPIEPWMKMYDLFFLSSITEGLPNVLIESQAIGTPIATMPAGGAPEAFIEGETGILLPEGESPEALADRIEALLLDKEKLAAFSAAAPESVTSRFGHLAMIEKTLGFYF